MALHVLLLFISFAFGATIPERTGHVTDVSEFIPDEVQDSLESRLASYQNTVGFDVAILVVDSIPNPSDPCGFATEVRKSWNLGGAERAGVLYLVVPPPMKKACIATAPTARASLSDAEAVRIIDQVAKPLNMNERRVEAIVAATGAILDDLGSTPLAQRTPPPKPAQPYVDRGTSSTRHSGATDDEVDTYVCVCIAIVLLLILFVFWLFSRNRGGGGGYGGGGYGGGGGSWSSSSSTVFIDNGGGGWGGHHHPGGGSWGGGGDSGGWSGVGDSGGGGGGGDGGGGGGGDSG